MAMIYLASRFARRLELQGYARELEAMGHLVTSRWVFGGHELEGHPAPEVLVRLAQEDMADIYASDVVVSFTESPPAMLVAPGRSGRMVELGMAIQAHKRVVVIGPRENIFCYLPDIEQYDTWADGLGIDGWLVGYEGGGRR